MLQIVKNILTNLGLNISQIPDLLIVIAVIIGIVVLLRILHEILESLISIGCIAVAVIIIMALLLEVF
ncbi:MAG: hypothetical protein ACPG8W_13875 [Candidatus Promineifilaceae bacterium]